MPISKERLEEIKAFKNTDFSDCPELTDEQLSQMKPSHYRNMANYRPIKKTVEVQTLMNYILGEAMLGTE